MDPTAIAVFTLAGSVFVYTVAWFFKTPKEVHGELAKQLGDVREDHELLARRFERHDEVVKNLIQALDRLTTRIDRLEPYLAKPNGRRGN